MQPAPPPANEAQRLEALRAYGILDTLPEQAYDDITSVASQICGSPIALMSLVDDDRQWFKSRVGLDAEETPRDLAFCAHAILEPEQVFVVEDAQADERFHDNPLVAENPKIRFYAGAPLVTSEGMGLGTLCVIDTQPRQLTTDQSEALASLARQVMAQLELRVAVQDLQAQARELEASREQLARSNEDLERFAYVAAHDLKAPLRHIKGFADLLSAELGDQLDEEKREYFEFITSSADRGQELIADILAYSQLESAAEPQSIVLDDLLVAIGDDLARGRSSGTLECGPLPTLRGDAGQLRQLFENLIENGLKYNENAAPKVRIDSGATDHDCWIALTDNGIGIPEEHQGKVFDMFTRVHGGSRYQGTGIGLAACKRVMELHDGQISVSGATDGGSVFTCRFPHQRIIAGADDAANLHTAG